ncbi:MAG: DUF6882 domain-containing protein [Pseudomonadota bacterium]
MTAATAPNPYELLVAEHIGLAWARQDKLADMIGEGAWDVDLQAGRLKFDSGPAFDIALLGSFGAKAGTWLWAWANESMGNLPDRVLGPSRAMRAFGEAKGFDQFTQGEIPADENDCRMLAMLAVGHLGKGAYYRGPYAGGAAYMLLDPVPGLTSPVPITAFPRLITEFATTGVPARPAVAAFFRAEGFEVSEDGDSLFARRGGASFMVTFEAGGRIAEIDGHLPGEGADQALTRRTTRSGAPASETKADPKPSDQLPVIYQGDDDEARVPRWRAMLSWVVSAFGRK